MTLEDKLSPDHTALIVIDIQNDFCSPTGVMASMGKDVSQMDSLVARLRQLTEVCGHVGIPVFYTQQIYDRTKLNDLQLEQYDLDGKLITCDIAGDGYKLYKLNPPQDRVYPKYSYNIFSNQQLTSDLEAAHIKTLIITGVSTQICVETAVRNGFDLGYKIVVPEDLVGTTSNDPDTQTQTLNRIRKTYGVVTTAQQVAAVLRAHAVT